MRANYSLNVYYLYEYLRRHNGLVSDYRIVKRFKYATSDEIFLAKCLFEDYKKKHNLFADRKCSIKSKTQNKNNTKSVNPKQRKRRKQVTD